MCVAGSARPFFYQRRGYPSELGDAIGIAASQKIRLEEMRALGKVDSQGPDAGYGVLSFESWI